MRFVGPQEHRPQESAVAGLHPAQDSDLKTVFPNMVGDLSRQPVFLNGQIHDDDFAVKSGFRGDVGIGRKQPAQRARHKGSHQHRERQDDDAAGLLDRLGNSLVGLGFFKIRPRLGVVFFGGRFIRTAQDGGAVTIRLPISGLWPAPLTAARS